MGGEGFPGHLAISSPKAKQLIDKPLTIEFNYGHSYDNPLTNIVGYKVGVFVRSTSDYTPNNESITIWIYEREINAEEFLSALLTQIINLTDPLRFT